MKENLVSIVAKQLDDAQKEFARMTRIVDRVQATLDKKQNQLDRACERLIDIEEIHNHLPR
jgi:ABC-type transporter Mla subunit MlaD